MITFLPEILADTQILPIQRSIMFVVTLGLVYIACKMLSD